MQLKIQQIESFDTVGSRHFAEVQHIVGPDFSLLQLTKKELVRQSQGESSMKKIDLHIHTYKTVGDPQNYDFDLDVLKRYVDVADLDAIAVTNHNLFDRKNYDSVRQELEIPVFPGIEVNVKTSGKYGHVLLIAPVEGLDRFELDAKVLSALLPERDSSVEWNQVISAFSDISKYLVIPHYRKDKRIDQNTLEDIRRTTGIDALEVSNAKKWLREQNSTAEPLVLFSDCRPGLRMDSTVDKEPDSHRYAYGFTYISCDEMSVPAIKRALAGAGNTAVFKEADKFEVLPEALPVSTGLNVLLGSRSSGKTYTLNRIADAYDKSDIVHIGQFEITKDAEEKGFNELVTSEDSKFEDAYLGPLQNGLMEYFERDFDGLRDGVRSYAAALITFARSPVDDASKVPIYRSRGFAFAAEDERAKRDIGLRNAVRKLLGEECRAAIIFGRVSAGELVKLDQDLRLQMFEDVKRRVVKERANRAISATVKRLGEMSARRPLPDMVPLHEYFQLAFYEKGLATILGKLLNPADLEEEEIGKFIKKRKRLPVGSSAEARRRRGVSVPTHTDLQSLYKQSNPVGKLRIIRGYQDVMKTSAAKLLIQVKSSILDKERCTPLSGGQRAEYVFLHKLAAAHHKDVVLVDEPESSFDNIFLKTDVSDALHRLAAESTIFLVTHNNTLGVSINPDWIIYSVYDRGEYRLYSGAMSSSELTASNGETVRRCEVLLDTMEAGRDAYEGRKVHYEIAQD